MIQLELTREQLNAIHERRFWWWNMTVVSDYVWGLVHDNRDVIMQLPAVYRYYPTPPRTLLYNTIDCRGHSVKPSSEKES